MGFPRALFHETSVFVSFFFFFYTFCMEFDVASHTLLTVAFAHTIVRVFARFLALSECFFVPVSQNCLSVKISVIGTIFTKIFSSQR